MTAAVADELLIPLYARPQHPTVQGGTTIDDSFTIVANRGPTPTLAIGGDTTWSDRHRDGFSTRQGLNITHVLVKALLYENDPHEVLVSGSFTARDRRAGEQSGRRRRHHLRQAVWRPAGSAAMAAAVRAGQARSRPNFRSTDAPKRFCITGARPEVALRTSISRSCFIARSRSSSARCISPADSPAAHPARSRLINWRR